MQNENNDPSGREQRTWLLPDAPVKLVWKVWTKPEHIKPYQKAMNKASLLVFLIMSLIGCNKDNSSDTGITNVTGVEWQMFSLQETNDPSINPIPVSWYLKLNKDRSFSFSLHNSTSTGTYTWVQSDSINAKVKFTIQSWNSSVSDTQYTNKLKTILQNIDSCHYLRGPYLLPIPFYINPAKMELQFHGSAGHFYVFTF